MVATARVSALLAWFAGLAFGIPGVYGTWYFAVHGEVWTFLDFPAYGDGPFEEIGIETSVPLLVAFLVVCAAEVVLGWWLWRRKPGARLFSLVLLPFELAFWLGFALPVGPLLGIVRTAMVLVGGRAPGPRS